MMGEGSQQGLSSGLDIMTLVGISTATGGLTGTITGVLMEPVLCIIIALQANP